jgi:tetratricopeptide (TPR) repeat protein
MKKAEDAKEANMPELEKYYYDAAVKVGTSDDDVLFSIGTYYASNEVRDYGQALEVFQKIKNQDRADVQASEAWCNYQRGNNSTAIQKAQQAFLNDPTNVLATITLYCAYDYKNDWDNCIKWADKSIELRPNFGQTYYIKAHAQYEKGYKASAQETYNTALALDPSNHYASDYAYIGGLPFSILSTEVANVHYNGNVINGYGHRINSNKTEYLRPRLKVSPNRTGSFKIDVKLYHNGNLSTGDSSKNGYSYSYTVYITNKSTQYITLSSWGNETPGHWGSGNYRFEFYYGGKLLGTKSFKIYNWWDD